MYRRHFKPHRKDVIGFEDFQLSSQVAPIENLLSVDRKMIAYEHTCTGKLLQSWLEEEDPIAKDKALIKKLLVA